MKLTQKDIDRCVCKVFRISLETLHSDSQKRAITDARNLAMLKGKEFLKLSSLKLKKHFGKDSHTTILEDLQSARNLIETDRNARERSAFVDQLIYSRIEYLAKNRRKKDLHYRIRKKGFVVNPKARTISIPPDRMPELRRSMETIKELGYNIQLSII